MRYNIVKADPATGYALSVERPGGNLPLRSFRDFYAFEQHVRSARARRGLDMIPEWFEIPVFYFSNSATLITDGDKLVAPYYDDKLDYELEIGAVLGRQIRDATPEEAEAAILGYCVLNDWSLRGAQAHEMKMNLGPAKGKDFATSLGTVLVSPDELEDRRSGKGYDLAMTGKINGQVISSSNWNTIHYSFGEMLARASQGVTLYPGELIGSGTCGTGCILELGPENTGGWLKAGDVIEFEIERLGTLKNQIVAAEQRAGE